MSRSTIEVREKLGGEFRGHNTYFSSDIPKDTGINEYLRYYRGQVLKREFFVPDAGPSGNCAPCHTATIHTTSSLTL